jgi:pimeloyl-ACP methyl ester carboxylesterase
VLVHGWSLDSRAWYYAQRQLAGRYRLIVWDLRGLGQSTRPRTNDYSLGQMAGDLEAVIDLAGPRPVALIGHSIGGMVIQEFCQRFPKALGPRVGRVVLVDTTYTNPLRTTVLRRLAQAIQKPVIEPLMHLTVWTSPLVWLMNLQSYQNGTMHLTTRLSSFAGAQTWRQVDFAARLSALQSPAVVAWGMLAMLRFDAQAALPRVNVPALVVHGANDRPVRVDAGEHLSRTIPDARLVILEPAGHLAILERHDEFLTAVSTFLGEGGQQVQAASAG